MAPGWILAGAVAQLEEHLLCKQEVVGSNPIGSTSLRDLDRWAAMAARRYHRRAHSSAG